MTTERLQGTVLKKTPENAGPYDGHPLSSWPAAEGVKTTTYEQDEHGEEAHDEEVEDGHELLLRQASVDESYKPEAQVKDEDRAAGGLIL